MINGNVIGQVLTWRESKILRRDIVSSSMWHIPVHHYSWPYYQLGIFSPFATRRVRKITRITNRRKNDNDGTFQYRIDLFPPRVVIRYRSNVSLHLASDYYLVNIDSQLAPALMRQRVARLRRTCWRRCLPSSALDRVISCKRCVVPSIPWLFTALLLNMIRLLTFIHFPFFCTKSLND